METLSLRDLPVDAVITLLLYLIGAPALLVQYAESDVRQVLIHNLRGKLVQMGLPAFAGLLVCAVVLILLRRLSPASADLVAFGLLFSLLTLAVISSFLIFPLSRKHNVVENLGTKILRTIHKKGRPDEDDLKVLTAIGMESQPGDEKHWTIQALAKITQAVLTTAEYRGCQLDGPVESLRKVVLQGSKMASPENFLSALDLLRGIIKKYYDCQEKNCQFSDADLAATYKLVSQMGQEAAAFSIEGIASACIDALEWPGIPNQAASQALSEIGMAAVQKNRIGTAMESLHILDAMIATVSEPLEGGEVFYDYTGLLAAFWHHGSAGREMARRYLDDLRYSLDVDVQRLINLSIEHHRMVGRFLVADRILSMWIEYAEG